MRQGFTETQRVLQVVRRFAPGRGIREIRNGRHRPGSRDQRVNRSEEGLRQSGERILIAGPRLNQILEDACFLGGDRHALAMDRIETANGITDRNEPAGEGVDSLVVTP